MNRSQIIVVGGAIALMIGATAALSSSSQKTGSTSTLEIQSSPTPSTPSSVESPPIPQVNASPSSPQASPSPVYISKQIGTCGVNNNANFRAYPSLDPRSILGVVAHGDTVNLTGRKVQGDGVDWYEAIAPPLYPSLDPNAQNQLAAGQVGWIASCFLDR